MSDLVAKLVLSGDASGIVGAATEGSAALDKVAGSAQRAGAAGAAMTGPTQASAAAMAAQSSAANAAAGGVARLAETEAARTAALATTTTETVAATAAVNDGAYAAEKFAVAAEHMGRSVLPVPISIRGLKAAFQGFGAIASDIGVVGFSVLGAAAAIGVLIAAGMSWDNAVAKLNETIAQDNNLLGLTVDQYQALAQQMATTADVSEKMGMGLAETLIQANVSTGAWNNLAQAASSMARAYGTDVPAAMQKLVEAEKDPAASAQDLATQFGILSGAQVQLIAHMQEFGDKGAAQDALARALTAHFKDAADNTSGWAKYFHILAGAVDAAWTSLGKWFGTDNSMLPWGMFPQAPPPSASQAAAAAHQAQMNQLSGQLGSLRMDQDSQGHASELNKNLQEQNTLRQSLNNGLITQAEYEQRLNVLDQEQIGWMDKKTASTAKLNDEDKKHLDAINSLVASAPKAIALAQADADALQQQAEASDGTAASIKGLQQAYEITKAIIPYTEAIKDADDLEKRHIITIAQHDAAVVKLKADIIDITSAMKQQQQAQDEITAKQEIHSQFGSLNLANDNDPQHVAQISAEMRQQDIQDAQAWQRQMNDVLVAAGLDNSQYADEVQDIFEQKIAKAYQDDLKRRTDWQAGVQRALDQLTQSTGNWAATSEGLVKSFSTEAEDEFVKLASDGKNVLQDFFTWIEQQLLKLAYQRFLQSSVNGLFGDLLGALGGAFGGDGISPSALSPGDFSMPYVGYHSGGMGGVDFPSVIMASPAIFENAPRLHSGSYPGLAANEIPVIIEDDEGVFTAAQMQAIGGALSRPIVIQMPTGASNDNGAPHIHLNIQNNHPGAKVSAGDAKRNPDGSLRMDVLVDQIDRTLAERNKNGRSAFTASMENTHQLSRRPGSTGL